MARPFLADPEFLTKTQEGRVDEINTCIACNQVRGRHAMRWGGGLFIHVYI